jgi:hypothetical protein
MPREDCNLYHIKKLHVLVGIYLRLQTPYAVSWAKEGRLTLRASFTEDHLADETCALFAVAVGRMASFRLRECSVSAHELFWITDPQK